MKKVVLILAAALMGVAANAQTLFLEDFESYTLQENYVSTTMPEGWTVYADNNANSTNYQVFGKSWVVGNIGSMGKAAFSTSYLSSSTAVCDRWLVTPRINIPAAGYALQFDVYGHNASYPESLKVMVSTGDSNKTSFTTTLLELPQVSVGINHYLIDMSDYADGDVFIAFVNYGTNGYFVGVDNVMVNVPENDAISYVSGYVASFSPINTDFEVYTLVQNRGTNNMTSYTLTYTLGNGAPQTRNVTGINVAPFASYIDTVTINYATVGTLDINLTVSAPNGQDDPDQSDNSGTLQTTMYDPAYTVQRNILFDHFTTAQCGNCPAAHERIHEAITGLEDRVEWVAHHVGYGTDGMTLSQDNSTSAIMGFYGSSTFAPAMMLDRDPDNVPGEYGGIIGGVDYAATVHNQFLEAMAKPAFVSVELQNLSYNSNSREVSFDVTGMFKQTLTGNVNVTVYITEDSIIAQQSGGSANYQHDHVLRKVITSYWGDAIEGTNANDTFTKHYTCTLPSTWKDRKCRLIAFVNKHDASSFYNRQVLNATKSDFLTSPTFGVKEVEPAISVKTWPNPVAETAYIDAESTIHSFSVVNAMGQKVMVGNVNADVLELDVRNLAAGIYFVSVTTDNGTATERLSIVK